MDAGTPIRVETGWSRRPLQAQNRGRDPEPLFMYSNTSAERTSGEISDRRQLKEMGMTTKMGGSNR